MGKVIIELAAYESIEVYSCIKVKFDKIKELCIETQAQLDEMETTHIAYNGTKNNLEMLTNALVNYTELMNKFDQKEVNL